MNQETLERVWAHVDAAAHATSASRLEGDHADADVLADIGVSVQQLATVYSAVPTISDESAEARPHAMALHAGGVSERGSSTSTKLPSHVRAAVVGSAAAHDPPSSVRDTVEISTAPSIVDGSATGAGGHVVAVVDASAPSPVPAPAPAHPQPLSPAPALSPAVTPVPALLPLLDAPGIDTTPQQSAPSAHSVSPISAPSESIDAVEAAAPVIPVEAGKGNAPLCSRRLAVLRWCICSCSCDCMCVSE